MAHEKFRLAYENSLTTSGLRNHRRRTALDSCNPAIERFQCGEKGEARKREERKALMNEATGSPATVESAPTLSISSHFDPKPRVSCPWTWQSLENTITRDGKRRARA